MRTDAASRATKEGAMRKPIMRSTSRKFVVTGAAAVVSSVVATVGAMTLSGSLTVSGGALTVRYPESWSVAPSQLTNVQELVDVPADRQTTETATARVKVRVQTRTDHQDALQQLREIAAEFEAPPTFLTIGGWPALQRRALARRQQPSQGTRHPDDEVLRVTTAVAAGDLLVRLEATLPADAASALVEEAEAIGRELEFASPGDPGVAADEINQLNTTPPPSVSGVPA